MTQPVQSPEQLLAAAREAARFAYCPGSNFHVGAAVVAGGKLYTGANVENASYGLTICAERVAIFKAVTDGERQLEAIAVACVDVQGDSDATHRMPCGACRQVIAEFANPDTSILVDGVGEFRLRDLLPQAFRF